MTIKFTDNALTTLATGIAAGATQLTVAAGTGARFPVVAAGAGNHFIISMEDSLGNHELIKCQERVTDLMGSGGYPLIRGYGGTAARAWNAGDSVDVRWNATALADHDVDVLAAVPVAVYGRVVRTAGNLTTSSTSLVDVTGATTTFTTGARPILVGFEASSYADSPGTNVFVNLDIDGSLQLGTNGRIFTQRTANDYMYHGFAHQSAALTAASHTAKAQWSVSAGTGTLNANANFSASFWAHEVR